MADGLPWAMDVMVDSFPVILRIRVFRRSRRGSGQPNATAIQFCNDFFQNSQDGFRPVADMMLLPEQFVAAAPNRQ